MNRRSFLRSSIVALAFTASSFRLAESSTRVVEPEEEYIPSLFVNMEPHGFNEGDTFASSTDGSYYVMTDGEWVKASI